VYVCVGRTPVLATSVQEQLETGSSSKEELPEETSQVDSTSETCLLSASAVCAFCCILVYDMQLEVSWISAECFLGSL